MIVPMKKLAILVQSKDSSDTVKKLRASGCVHVENQILPQSEDITHLKDDIARVDEAVRILEADDFIQEGVITEDKEPQDWQALIRYLHDLRSHFNQLKEYSLTLEARIGRWKIWGDFDPDEILRLKDKGICCKLYEITLKQLKGLSTDVIIRKISVFKGTANCLAISKTDIDLPFKEVPLPKISLSAMQARLAEDIQMMRVIKDDIAKAGCYHKVLINKKRKLEHELEFYEAVFGMGKSGRLAYLTGYVPYDAVKSLEKKAGEENWGILISEPTAEDKVPTLVRNSRWVSIIEPVFKLIEVVPGYRELDISLWFLIFFSIFFGMLIGDAGIGLVFLSLTFFAQRKFGAKMKNQSLFFLFYISSACTVIWGILTATFFGQEWLSSSIKPLIPALRNERVVQTICFFIGAFHLSIAHLWRALRKAPALTLVSELGWVLILWGAFFLARTLVLAHEFPQIAKWLFITGATAVVLFTSPSKNILKSIGSGMGNLLLNFINNFTDVVSYVRLFAVGLATVAVADAFNKMAMEVGFGSLLSGVITICILLLGHSLNIVLAPMSILVHGVRLNVLEFCSHLEITWSGFSYKPLQEEVDRLL